MGWRLIDLGDEYAIYTADDVMVALFPANGVNPRKAPTVMEKASALGRASVFLRAMTWPTA